MPLEKEAFVQKVEEFKELGHEIRYREQLMVQEFSLSMIATGVALSALAPRWATLVGLTIQAFGAAFMLLLSLHLRNISQDRLAGLTLREGLRKELGFGLVHQNLGGNKRWSAPRLMIWFSRSVGLAWTIWTIATVAALVQGQISN